MGFDEIYDQYFPRVYRFIKMKTMNDMDSEDITVEVFEKVYKNIEKYSSDKASLDTWIFTIARNELASFYRKNKIKTVAIDSIAELKDEAETPELALENKFKNKKLIDAINKLNENERRVVSYKYGAGLKNTDIAELMEISSSNVGVVLFRSIKKLQKELEG